MRKTCNPLHMNPATILRLLGWPPVSLCCDRRIFFAWIYGAVSFPAALSPSSSNSRGPSEMRDFARRVAACHIAATLVNLATPTLESHHILPPLFFPFFVFVGRRKTKNRSESASPPPPPPPIVGNARLNRKRGNRHRRKGGRGTQHILLGARVDFGVAG